MTPAMLGVMTEPHTVPEVGRLNGDNAVVGFERAAVPAGSFDGLVERACQAIYREFDGYWPSDLERARIAVAIKEVMSW